MARRGRGGGGQGGLFNLREDIERRDPQGDFRDDGREQSERSFREREQQRDNDRRQVEELLRDNNVQVDDLVSLAVEVMVDQFHDGVPIGEKTLQKAFGKNLGAALTSTFNPVGRLAASSGKLSRTGFGSGRFQKQFGQNMGFNFSQLKKPKRKRSAKQKAADKKLSIAFEKANATCRKVNGDYKKNKCQADIAKMAHRLVKKM